MAAIQGSFSNWPAFRVKSSKFVLPGAPLRQGPLRTHGLRVSDRRAFRGREIRKCGGGHFSRMPDLKYRRSCASPIAGGNFQGMKTSTCHSARMWTSLEPHRRHPPGSQGVPTDSAADIRPLIRTIRKATRTADSGSKQFSAPGSSRSRGERSGPC